MKTKTKNWYTGVRGNTVYSSQESDVKITVECESKELSEKIAKLIAESLNESKTKL